MYVDCKHRLKVSSNSLLQAVGACFKLIYLFELELPPEAKHIYQFLQYVYAMVPEKCHKYEKVRLFVENLNHLEIIGNPVENPVADIGENNVVENVMLVEVENQEVVVPVQMEVDSDNSFN